MLRLFSRPSSSPRRQPARETNAHAWQLAALESRLLLAADVPADAGVVAASDSSETSTSELVFIDSEIADLDQLAVGLIDNAELHIVPLGQDGIEYVSRVLSSRDNLTALHFVTHGSAGSIRLGGTVVDAAMLSARSSEIAHWQAALAIDADILLYGCDTGKGKTGEQFVDTLAALTKRDVAASVDRTGNRSGGANWTLERSHGLIETGLAFSANVLADYAHTLPIVIRAAGTTGDETMQLLIDGVAVQTWVNIGGDAYGGVFQTYTYQNAGPISADRVSAAFTNDLSRPDGYDRNLRVDNISIDGVVFETEAPNVYSTGTYLPADGVVPGFRLSEFLHADGYFQYAANTPTQTGSLIEIFAAGETGGEEMQLAIRGHVVATWGNIAGDQALRQFTRYQFRAPETVTADEIQVYFTNDDFVVGVPDRNLYVDRIAVDGVTYQTEANSTFSTGSFSPIDGIVPGFRQSEVLNVEAFFQYSTETFGSGTRISILAAGSTGSERMQLLVNNQVVKTWDAVAVGADTQTYRAYSVSVPGNVTADKVRVAFLNDGLQGGVDRNLRIDRIVVGSAVFETEAPSVFTQLAGAGSGYRENEYLFDNGYVQYQAIALNPGVISIQSSVIDVKENDGTAQIRIIRSQGSDGSVSVDYNTFAATALAGKDFRTTTGTVTFAPGEVSKTISVPLINNIAREATEVFNFAIDNVTGGALLLAPRTATVTIIDDDVKLPSYASFPNKIGLTTRGSATVAGGKLIVSPASSNRIGSVYANASIPISEHSSFQSSFQFDLTGVNAAGQNSGLLFVLQNSPAGKGAIGSGIASLGYAGVTNSLAIQFDTQLLFGGSSVNNLRLLTGGSLTPIATARTPLIEYVPGSTGYAWIDYNGANDRLQVYVSASANKPGVALLSTTIDLAAIVGNQAYFGFSAGSGTAATPQQVRNWSVILDRPGDSAIGGGAPGLVSETILAGLFQPTAIEWSPDGRNLYITQKDGVVRVARDGVLRAAPFIDISAIVNTAGDRGLTDVALHPDFANNPYVYLLFTYDPPEVNNNVGNPLAGPDGEGNRTGRLIRLTANAATNYTTVVSGSEVVLLGTNGTWSNFNGFVNSTIDFDEPPAGILAGGANLQNFIAADSTSHAANSINFGPDGALYVSIGDGTSFNRVDTRAFRVQDVGNLSGKILRINPLTGAGYAINPFANDNLNSNESKVYQLGLRNPFRFSIDPRNGKLYVGDVGWTNWEELNAGGAGANYGWPFYEGGSTGSQHTTQYNATPQAQAFYASGTTVTAPLIALNHSADNINAIIGGDIYLGSAYPAEYFGDVFFNDLGQGIVRHASLNAAGQVTQIEVFATGAAYVVQIVQGPDGRLYYVDLDDGLIGRWSIV